MKKLYFLVFLMVVTSMKADCPCDRPWSFGPKIGINPAWYGSRTATLTFSQVSGSAGLSSQIKIPQFSKQFNTPLYIGGDIGYEIADNLDIFLDLNYTRARGKKIEFISQEVMVSQDFSNFQAFGAYVGIRYYGDLYCRWFVPYIGGKFGVQSRNRVLATMVTNNDPATMTIFTFFKRNSAVSGSIQGGFNIQVCRFMSIYLQAEALFSGPQKSNAIITVAPNPITVVGTTGTIFSVPLSIGFMILI